MVLADGRIVHANSKENHDLWLVLKGGGNNFGIVIRIDLTVFDLPTGNIWGGVVCYPESTIPEQIKAFVAFTDNIELDPYASLIMFFSYSSATETTVVTNIYDYTKPEANPPIFNYLLDIKPEVPDTNTLRLANLSSLTTELNFPYDFRNLFSTLSFTNEASIITEIHALSQALLGPFKQTKGLNWLTMFQPLPTLFTERSRERGGNILGLDRAKGNQVLFLFFVSWEDEKDDKALNMAAETMIQRVKELTKQRGKDNDWIYLNYGLPSQDVLGSYGKENVQKMRRASKKYDPRGLFQKLVAGGFKISNMKAPTDQQVQ